MPLRKIIAKVREIHGNMRAMNEAFRGQLTIGDLVTFRRVGDIQVVDRGKETSTKNINPDKVFEIRDICRIIGENVYVLTPEKQPSFVTGAFRHDLSKVVDRRRHNGNSRT